MAGLNACGLQSKLLIGASLSEPHLVRTMISLSVYIYMYIYIVRTAFWSRVGPPRKCATRKRIAGRIRVRGHTHGRHNREETK